VEGDYYTPQQAARILRRTDRYVRKLLERGDIEGEQDDGGRWMIPARAIHDRLQERPLKTPGGWPPEAVERINTLEREVGRLEGEMKARAELTEVAESTLREERSRLLKDLEREREKADTERERAERFEAEARKLRERLEMPWWRRVFNRKSG
jgi:excisionase family DNA binding protein